MTNLGMVEIRAGNPRDALTLLTDALTLQRASKNGVGEENALGQLGTAYDAMGEPQLAFAYLDSALALRAAMACVKRRPTISSSSPPCTTKAAIMRALSSTSAKPCR